MNASVPLDPWPSATIVETFAPRLPDPVIKTPASSVPMAPPPTATPLCEEIELRI